MSESNVDGWKFDVCNTLLDAWDKYLQACEHRNAYPNKSFGIGVKQLCEAIRSGDSDPLKVTPALPVMSISTKSFIGEICKENGVYFYRCHPRARPEIEVCCYGGSLDETFAKMRKHMEQF